MTSKSDTFELRQTPGIWTAFRQQLWLLAASGRWAGMTLSILVLMVILDAHTPAPVPGVLTLAVILLPVSALWAIVVWSGEGPNQRGYHWSMPVPRAAHELARVAAGALYLVAMCAVFAVADALMSSLEGQYAEFAAIDAGAWANYFIAPVVVYLLATPLVLWRDYAVVRWLLGGLCFLGILTPLLETQGIHILSSGWQLVFFGSDAGLGLIINGLLDALNAATGDLGMSTGHPWQTAAMVWLAIGLVLTAFAALFRPDDLLRMVKRPHTS